MAKPWRVGVASDDFSRSSASQVALQASTANCGATAEEKARNMWSRKERRAVRASLASSPASAHDSTSDRAARVCSSRKRANTPPLELPRARSVARRGDRQLATRTALRSTRAGLILRRLRDAWTGRRWRAGEVISSRRPGRSMTTRQSRAQNAGAALLAPSSGVVKDQPRPAEVCAWAANVYQFVVGISAWTGGENDGSPTMPQTEHAVIRMLSSGYAGPRTYASYAPNARH